VVKDWHEGCERVLQLLRYGGTGHTMAIHSRDDAVIREFAIKKPVFRIVANTQSSMGATGYTTGLAPSMSLGCGAYAGNITSDNITPLHLINVKRLAYELPREGREAPGPAPTASPSPAPAPPPAPAAAAPRPAAVVPPSGPPVDFVSEDDVRRALREGRTIRVAPKGIVTPSAMDLAEGKQVLILDADRKRS
jgi:acetaldehyde dehydrogenase (acetylating)